jgi:acetyl esterase/lipase
MKTVLAGLAILISYSLNAQQTVIHLYNGTAPGSENWKQKEVVISNPQFSMVRNVVDPSLTVFLPEESKATGTAVIVAPGGGFRFLTWDNEGTKVAEWLQSLGIAAFVLKYRLVDMGQTDEDFQKRMQEFMQQMTDAGRTNDPKALLKDPDVARVIELAKDDGRQAIKYVRANAAIYKVKPDRIGLMGFSAGGILTMGVALHHDAESRPDFIAPIYGIALDSLIVPADAPPMFYTCAADDGLVATMADKIYSAWKGAGKSIEFHVYSKGGHGFGMRKRGMPIDKWIEQFVEWLNIQGF